MKNKKIHIIGAGLAGPLMATYLAKRGYLVEMYERRSDMRKVSQSAGRSINLALSVRGIQALREVGLYDKIKPITIPMKGRMIHDLDGKTHIQPYGQHDKEVIYSVSRAELNMGLMTLAEETKNVKIFFNHKVESVDLTKNILDFGKKQTHFGTVIGCDGSTSPLREAIIEKSNANFVKKPLGHSYKELVIPPSDSNDFLIEPNALHIWPRGDFMLIALPNMDKTFTCTLFLPTTGEISFETIYESSTIIDLFQNYFPDALELMSTLVEDFQSNPIGNLASVYCKPWHYKGKALLVGDAAHAVVPFFGQGMNASFQDCSVLNNFIEKHNGNWEKTFEEFSSSHVENGHAIADMAIENYIEMRDSVNDEFYRKRRKLELELERQFPDCFIPRYSMVSFHQIPYADVYCRGQIQLDLMNKYLIENLTKQQLHSNITEKLVPLK
ncbi:MAG: FAD-dependent monooxygenase [Candidatus Marinimicrobia bacterium]|jgi:kynurenine 3-monooxygenase|nr:FAD-dependent monooxygenase [Candidatus Neomarinimicrobiota bacterium]MBT3848952.1 FAD-dependent monooxygenase [Candidatus Neomarinimicrobiota bacterium]MBT4054143.1 FAD-dependent monooxygenase [Candidatus Neomarinimicrobiota bacterium]MBT4370264.1 FAD-dependent monooxygenase [Candidatus Neomarinimicrobiota bacterium]MBT4660879.1 FAD-dependent monooxygenase [Candidatus Neomarinimicrobiota bacterium]|tara:strand:+ start:339 stop:1661 length:1323 start_codon:yes stop_codon:yes gene_type:complete